MAETKLTWQELPIGAVIEEQDTAPSAVATGTTIIPIDDTNPQNTEGDQYMSVSITPKSTTSKLVIQILAMVANSAISPYIAGALFQDSTANALNAVVGRTALASDPLMLSLTHPMLAGTTSATTFKFRVGGGAAGTTTFNGQVGGRFFGAIPKSSMVITEFKA